ncbi:MAG: serine hydrolase, partial [bacterium]|nr:serine hydrolase [bacterium]
MKHWILWIFLFTSLLRAATSGISMEWSTTSPESQGFSSSQLQALTKELAPKGTKTLLLIRGDQIIHEWYAPGFNSAKPHYTASLAKSLVGGLSLALAMSDGLIQPDDLASRYIPQWREDPRKARITIRHLATHSSGIEDAELSEADRAAAAQQDQSVSTDHMQLPGWKGAFWRKEPNPFTLARDQAPVCFEPGTQYAYSNPGMAMLSYAITAAMQNSPYDNIRTYLRDRLFRPLGIEDREWSIGYGQTYEVDGLNLVANWGGGGFTPRAVARIGHLLLRGGEWDGKPLLNPAVVRLVTSYAGTPLPDRPQGNPQPACGLGWYCNFDGNWGNVPRDAFAGAGAGNQVLLVIPSLDLILVRNGSNLFDESKGEGFWGGLENSLFVPILRAFEQAPYPPSEIITNIDFSLQADIVRLAEGSDNWPITEGVDHRLFTAYGDGWGFDPKVEKKLSLGLATVTGVPPAITGTNLRSPSAEQLGQGELGAKASGLLMINSTLYMLARNTGNARLAWSRDEGKTWTWADWRFDTSFGCPTFLQFGPNYSGARDAYVYLYSQDENSAYQAADRMVLARVPQEKITEPAAYEY